MIVTNKQLLYKNKKPFFYNISIRSMIGSLGGRSPSPSKQLSPKETMSSFNNTLKLDPTTPIPKTDLVFPSPANFPSEIKNPTDSAEKKEIELKIESNFTGKINSEKCLKDQASNIPQGVYIGPYKKPEVDNKKAIDEAVNNFKNTHPEITIPASISQSPKDPYKFRVEPETFFEEAQKVTEKQGMHYAQEDFSEDSAETDLLIKARLKDHVKNADGKHVHAGYMDSKTGHFTSYSTLTSSHGYDKHGIPQTEKISAVKLDGTFTKETTGHIIIPIENSASIIDYVTAIPASSTKGGQYSRNKIPQIFSKEDYTVSELGMDYIADSTNESKFREFLEKNKNKYTPSEHTPTNDDE